MNNEETPITQDIPKIRCLPPRNQGKRPTKFFITHCPYPCKLFVRLTLFNLPNLMVASLFCWGPG